MNERTLVIGDVHGCIKTLRGLLESICTISNNDTLIFIGDLIDKGPDSKAVLDYILELKSNNYNVVYIRGNHEQMFINALDHSIAMKEWFRNGGQNTLDSFDAYHPGFIDDKYIDLILSSQFYYQNENYIFAHAGLNFNIENPLSDKTKMLSSRSDFCDTEKIGLRKLVVGHTPVTLEKIKFLLSKDLIRVDGGCVYHKQVQGLGYLVALDTESLDLFHLQNIESETSDI
jgi:serine/threonine protein phosphatase 1